MKKIILLVLSFFIITGCNKKEDKEEQNYTETFIMIDNKLKENNISFTREAKLNEETYYAKEGWQYVIEDKTCIVDIYYFGEDSNLYKDAKEKGAIRNKDYDDNYIAAVVTNGIAAIIWDNCSKQEEIKQILLDL